MLRLTILAVLIAAPAYAGCEFATTPCYTDGSGNTYRTQQNFGGGYNTYRNGTFDSQTSQGLSGDWVERDRYGTERRRYNSDPYGGIRLNN